MQIHFNQSDFHNLYTVHNARGNPTCNVKCCESPFLFPNKNRRWKYNMNKIVPPSCYKYPTFPLVSGTIVFYLRSVVVVQEVYLRDISNGKRMRRVTLIYFAWLFWRNIAEDLSNKACLLVRIHLTLSSSRCCWEPKWDNETLRVQIVLPVFVR
jgi:hypothetical protein